MKALADIKMSVRALVVKCRDFFMKRIKRDSSTLNFISFCFLLLSLTHTQAQDISAVPVMALSEGCDNQITQEAESSVSLIRKYDQDFDIKLSKSSGKEALLVSNLSKLGIKLDDIDEYFYENFKKDIADLNATLKRMRSHSRKNKDVAQMVDSLKVSLRNASNLHSLLRKHHDFIKGYQIINFYKSLPVDSDKLIEWVILRQDSIYPLLDYVDVVDSQAYWIYWLRLSHYPHMVKTIQATKKAMMKSASMLRKTRAFKDEFHVKQEVDMKAAMLSAQQEIARAQTKALLKLCQTN